MDRRLDIIRPVFLEAMEIFRDEMALEARAQGHYQTGAGESSLEIEVKESTTGLQGVITGQGYLLVVNAGLPPERIRYPIRVMIQYFRRHGLSDREATRAAWATRTIHKRTGMPTRGSYAFSSTGERKGFLTRAIDRGLSKVSKLFETRLPAKIDMLFAGSNETRASIVA